MITALHGIIAAAAVTEEAGTGAPGAPQNITVTPSSEGTLLIEWDAPATGGAPTYYRIEIDEGSGYVEVYNGLPSPLEFYKNSLSNGTSFPVRVHAGNLDGEAYADSSGYTLPGVPVSVNVTPGLGELAFTWSHPDGGKDAYELDYATDTAGPWTTVPESSASTSSTITGLSAGDFYARMRSKLNAGPLYSAYVGSGSAPGYSGPHSVT